MDQIINNPGLQHITENILLNLDFKNLQVCQSANKNFGQILANNPIFWLKKFRLTTNSPGLQSLKQINEDVFLDFDLTDLAFLESVNETFAEILDNPTFWLKKCMGLENFTKLRSSISRLVIYKQKPLFCEERLAKKIKIAKDTEFHSLVWSYVKNSVDEIIAAMQIDIRMGPGFYSGENCIMVIDRELRRRILENIRSRPLDRQEVLMHWYDNVFHC